MRYLSTLSLALIVHVLLSIVAVMALACTATPAWRLDCDCRDFRVRQL